VLTTYLITHILYRHSLNNTYNFTIHLCSNNIRMIIDVYEYCDMTPESCNLPTCWEGLRWARSRGNIEGAATGRRIVWTRFHGIEDDWTRNALHTESRWFLGNAYRNVSVHTATNLQNTATAKTAITLLLKGVIIRFDQNLPQWKNWPTEDSIWETTNRSQKWSLYFMWCSYSNLYSVIMVRCYEVLKLQ
jgi:hypothetical protein